MINALWITLIGMSLVFVAILLLWGMMVLLVRVTAGSEREETPALESAVGSGTESSMNAIPEDALQLDRKRRAAAAAVAAAVALQKTNGTARLPEKPVSVSAWQAVHRASQLSRLTNGARKKVIR
jgi:Na+-transporting methylmalonyl-CoA/oxaloacetate decarboxylase gamma subunit